MSMIQDIKYFILIFVLFINIACQNVEQNKSSTCDSIKYLTELECVKDSIRILKNMLSRKRYYEYSKFEEEPSDNDSTLFARFVNSVTEVNAPLNINIEFLDEDKIKKNDSISFIAGDSGRILNGRIISNDCDYKNELTIILPFFINIYSKYEPYISGIGYKDVGFYNKHKFFPTNKKEKDFIYRKNEYYNAILIISRIKIRENQKFFLFHLTISKTKQGQKCGYPLLCTFQPDGELIDCLSIPSCKSGLETDSIDSNGLFHGSICVYWQVSENDEYYDYNKCLNYIIRITDNGYFKLVKYDVKTNKDKQE